MQFDILGGTILEVLLDGMILSAQLREECAQLFANLPAARLGEQDAALDGISRAAYCTLRCADNISAFSLLSSQAPHAKPISLSGLSECFLHDASSVCRRIDFRFAALDQPLWTMGNEKLFTITLANLVLNAIVYGGERPQVSVRCYQQGNNAVLTVCDNGAGLPPADFRKVMFAPWFSAKPGTQIRGGMGLGLAIAHRYVLCYGGRIAAEQTAKKGCRFLLSLPLCASQTFIRPEYVADRTSVVYVQLAPVCDLPL